MKTDNETYLGVDSGCPQATEYLGENSLCLRCPFKRCVYEKRANPTTARNLVIITKIKAGENRYLVAQEFGLTYSSVNKILRKEKNDSTIPK